MQLTVKQLREIMRSSDPAEKVVEIATKEEALEFIKDHGDGYYAYYNKYGMVSDIAFQNGLMSECTIEFLSRKFTEFRRDLSFQIITRALVITEKMVDWLLDNNYNVFEIKCHDDVLDVAIEYRFDKIYKPHHNIVDYITYNNSVVKHVNKLTKKHFDRLKNYQRDFSISKPYFHIDGSKHTDSNYQITTIQLQTVVTKCKDCNEVYGVPYSRDILEKIKPLITNNKELEVVKKWKQQ